MKKARVSVTLNSALVKAVPKGRLSSFLEDGLLWRLGLEYGIDLGRLFELIYREKRLNLDGIPEEDRLFFCLWCSEKLLQKYGAQELYKAFKEETKQKEM